MAKITMKGFDEMEKWLDKKAQKSPALMKRCVYAGAYAAADEVRKNAQSAIKTDEEHKKRQTGDMLKHLGINSISGGLGEARTSLGFSGYDSKGVPVPLIAATLESGNSTNSQQATHFFSKAIKSARPKAFSAMQKIVQKFMDNQGE